MTDEERAKKIWKAVFDELYDRKGFDNWWDDIDEFVQRDIRECATEIIETELKRG